VLKQLTCAFSIDMLLVSVRLTLEMRLKWHKEQERLKTFGKRPLRTTMKKRRNLNHCIQHCQSTKYS
jgi:hypothetical protein